MLQATALNKTYGQTVAVERVDVALAPGRVVGLVGANGAGKTTTIKMLAGLVEPTAGSVLLDGIPTTNPRARQRIGYLPEESPLYDDESPVGYLRFFAGLYGLDRRPAKKMARQLLSGLGLEENALRRPIGTFSKGMKRKVAVARTLLHEPDVVLLDEPTSGLDPPTARELDDFIRRLRDDGRAVLLSAHNLPQVEELCDEILIVHQGRVAARGSLQDLRMQWGTQRYHVRATVAFPTSQAHATVHQATFESWDAVEKALQSIRAADGVILEVEATPPRLDEILRNASQSK